MKKLYEKTKKFINETVKETPNFLKGFLIGYMLVYGAFKVSTELREGSRFLKVYKSRAVDFNKDGLTDICQKGLLKDKIYLQTKDGKFVSYESVMQEEKAKQDSTYKVELKNLQKAKTKIDSIYQAKQDSLKEVYESKLEKLSGEN